MKQEKKRTELSCVTALWISMAREVNNRSITKINLLVYCNYVRMFLFVGDWWLHDQKTTMKNKSRGRMNRQVWKCIAHGWDAVIEATTICEMNQFDWHTGRHSKIITLYTVWKTKELMMDKFNINNSTIGAQNSEIMHIVIIQPRMPIRCVVQSIFFYRLSITVLNNKVLVVVLLWGEITHWSL